jgi:hypothetical protein
MYFDVNTKLVQHMATPLKRRWSKKDKENLRM